MKILVLTLVAAAALLLPGCGPRDAGAKAHKGALHQYRLGSRKYRDGDFETAIKIYEKALQIDPNLAAAHLDLGIIYDDYRADKKRAVAHYKEYLRLEPQSEKAEMVARWIHSAEEEKGEGVAAQAPGAGGAESTGVEAELQQARQDMASLRTEKDAYLKTVETLREELSQAKQQLGALLAKGGRTEDGAEPDETENEAGSAEGVKAQLLERYQREKGQVEKAMEALRGEIASLQAQKRAGDEALKKSNERFEALKKAASEEKGGQVPEDSLRQKLALVNEKCAELQREGAIYLKDNKVLLSKLKKAERDLEEYRARGGAGAAAQGAPPPAAAALVARVKSEGEREREELRRSYEKRLAEFSDAASREKAGLQRALAELQRQVSAPSPAAAAPPPAAQGDSEKAVARVKAEAEREREELRQRYEKKLSELSGALGREKFGVQRELADARRETIYLKTQLDREKERAGMANQTQADAIRRLNEQHRKEKAELEERLYRGRERHSGARTAAQAPGGTTVLPQPQKPARETAVPAVQKGAEPKAQKSAAAAPGRRYQVVRGDSLKSISVRFYGAADRWKAIYDANRGILESPNAPLRAGKILTIP